MLVANAVVDPDQPRLQVGENQMDDRQVLLGNSEVLIAALTEASIAAPIVSNDQRSRRDGALDEPTERLGATVEHDGEPNASGIASVFPVVELWTHPGKSGGALHRLHCFCLEFDGACEVQRRVPTDWIIEPVDVSGYGSFSLAS